MSKHAFAKRVGLCVAAGALVLVGCRKSEPDASKPPEAPPAAPAAAAAPKAAPTAPAIVTETVAFDGQDVTFTHSAFDQGRIQDLFDADPNTLARTTNANPAVLELAFSKPRPVKGVELTTGSMDMDLTCVVRLEGGGEKTFTKELRNLKPDPTVRVDFDGLTGRVEKLRIEVKSPSVGDGHIHLRTLRLR
jgi:hypothetical protein